MANEDGNSKIELDPSLILEEQSEEQEQADPLPDQEPEEEIPAKYHGKTQMEIIRMHQDAERLIGKQGNELGSTRSVLDDIIRAQTQASTPAPQEPEVDFFEDPKGASSRAARDVLASDPELQQMKRSVEAMRRDGAAQRLISKHPDAQKIAGDPKFQAWIEKSQMRTRMYEEANTGYDANTASELFDMYKETKQFNDSVATSAANGRKQDVNRASTGSGKASSETRGKPILSREAVVKLKMTDPDKYAALLPELKQAYLEKRVR